MPNEIETMKTECRAAAEWWGSIISKQGLANEPAQISKFQTSLQHLMESKYTGHWYEAQPWRGNAYRSIAVDRRSKPYKIDEMLVIAAESAMIMDLPTRLMPIYTHITMWVDPGECTVRYALQGAKQENTLTVYSKSNQPVNSPSTTYAGPTNPVVSSNTVGFGNPTANNFSHHSFQSHTHAPIRPLSANRVPIAPSIGYDSHKYVRYYEQPQSYHHLYNTSDFSYVRANKHELTAVSYTHLTLPTILRV
eukprot:TRINITY_DN2559_c0_g1_i1.p1 TRINITY_DN2559_c0_g1~~TRINITY_DN2559_c0_g1_i1.p1  ORF type:complete len:250 (+),score=23.04 TRINITY_DN2559_c0_g1_i1:211-960(+)